MPKKLSDSPEFSAYKQALAHWSAKDKFIKTAFQKILSVDSCDSRNCTLKFRDVLCNFYDLLEKPADFFLTEKEWRA